MGFTLGVGGHVFDTGLPLEPLLNHTRMVNAGVVLLELDFSIIIQQSLMDGIIKCFKMGLYEGHLGALVYACGGLFHLLHGRYKPNNTLPLGWRLTYISVVLSPQVCKLKLAHHFPS
jgi:hypothetical protein